MADPGITKQLKIKTGVLKRNVKDLQFAQAQLKREQDRLVTFAGDDDKIHQQQKVIQEHESTIPRCLNRIRDSHQDLEEYLGANTESLDAESTDVQDAKTILEEVAKLLE